MKAHIAAGGSLVVGGALMAAILFAGPGMVGPWTASVLGETASDAAHEALFVVLLFGAMIAVALAAGAILRRSVVALGAHPAREAAIGLALGAFAIAVATSYAGIAGALIGGASGAALAPLAAGALLVLFQAAAEEIYFRGWIQPVVARAWGVVPAVLLTSLGFAALHFVGGDAQAPLSFVNLLLGGLLFGTLAARGGGIAGALGAHFAWNATEQLVLGLDPNPGIGTLGALLDLELVGAAGWGGSAEGLNASLAMAMALLVVLVPLALLTHGPYRAQP